MEKNSSVVRFRQPDAIDDPLTGILRSGARRLLTQAVEMEAEAFLATMKDLKLLTVAAASCGMVMVPSARSRQASGRLRSAR